MKYRTIIIDFNVIVYDKNIILIYFQLKIIKKYFFILLTFQQQSNVTVANDFNQDST
jgi:hypothetical protein